MYKQKTIDAYPGKSQPEAEPEEARELDAWEVKEKIQDILKDAVELPYEELLRRLKEAFADRFEKALAERVIEEMEKDALIYQEHFGRLKLV